MFHIENSWTHVQLFSLMFTAALTFADWSPDPDADWWSPSDDETNQWFLWLCCPAEH